MKSLLRIIISVVCAGSVLLMASNAWAQNLFAANFWNNEIYEITPSGVQSTFATGNFVAGGPGAPAGPFALAFDTAGNLFIGTYGTGYIYEITPDGTQSTFASGLYSVTGLAFDSAGNLFAVDGGNGNPGTGYIYKFTPDGAQSTFASGLNSPVGLTFDSAGNLYEADDIDGIIYEFTPNGTQSTFASGLTGSVGLAFNNAGDLFVLVRNSGSIIEITSDDTQSTFISGLDYNIVGLAIDTSGNLFVGDGSLLNANIIEITPDGTPSVFATGFDAEGLTFQPTPDLEGAVTPSGFQISVSMPPPCRLTIIQASTNMVDWENICTNTPPFTFTDSMGTTLPCRYYRALLAH